MTSLESLVQKIELFQRSLDQVHVVNCLIVAVFSALLYDAILTFPKEIELIWRKPYSLPKLLYLISRYYGLVNSGTVLFISVAPNWPISPGILGPQIIGIVVNLIFLLRIYAIYGRSKKLLCLLIPLYLAETACVLYGGFEAAKQEVKDLMALPFKISVSGCQLYVVVALSFKVTLTIWVPGLLLSAIFSGLSFYKVIVDFGLLRNRGEDYRLPVLVKVIFLDGIIYYFANTLVALLGVVLVTREHNPLAFVPPIAVLVYSLCGSHFLLNFYEIAEKGQTHSPTQATDVNVVLRTLKFRTVVEPEFELSGTRTLA